MLKSYLEILLVPDTEIGINFLWAKVFQQIHLAIVEQLDDEGYSAIGVSFPEYSSEKRNLGRKLRIFAADNSVLKKLDITEWLDRLRDYVNISAVNEVPDTVPNFACYKRDHIKSSIARIARRKAKRENLSVKKALVELEGFKERHSDAPYINMKSSQTNQSFKLFIVRQEVATCTDSKFGSYGLSASSAVPEF